MSLYLDASVLVPTFIDEPISETIDKFLLGNRQECLVSDFAAAEVSAAVSRLVRMNILNPTDASAQLADFDTWRAADTRSVDLHAADARLAHAYVRRFGLMLRAPDALHLAIARRLDAMLVTLDRRLANAAAALGIAVELPGRS
ncbi:MAG TPA: type II toxin-antitoxin system VapC family toxin [Stellaceae bacterium]|nr:type II toxin-antitoxin system VapC family toxin [Stellaceae bacterium]